MRRKKRRASRLLRVLISFFCTFLFLTAGTFLYYSNGIRPVQNASEKVNYTVPSGASSGLVLSELEQQKIIRSKEAASFLVRLKSLSGLKAGTYELDKSWDTEMILRTLNDSSAALSGDVSVTIIEGDWAKHIAQKIASVTNVSEEQLLSLWNSREYIETLMGRYSFLTNDLFNEQSRILLEGYLAPNTYRFDPNSSAEVITERILDQTQSVYQANESLMKQSDLSVHEIYTLASIVQYESGHIEDMKKIAGVFYNRLAVDMPLQSSVTVCYAIDLNKEDDWMKCEVNSSFDSPYNTYKYKGLPPGPIENPGVDAISAVLNPDHNDYYYFMADVYGDGTVHYARTYEEHQANVNQYLK